MEYKQESYPAQIRRIAEDMTQMRKLYELDYAVEKLRKIADKLEERLKKDSYQST